MTQPREPRDPETLMLDLIGEWHDADGADRPLPEYLGMTNDQYAQWVMGKLPAADLAEWAKNRSTP